MPKFETVELMLMELLVAASSQLATSERAEIQRFIDVGEYGLALDTATLIYLEEGKIASAAVFSLVERLATAMSLETDLLLERLRRAT